MGTFDTDSYITDLPYDTLCKLAGILDVPGPRDWKAVIRILPQEKSYSKAEINAFERANTRHGGSAALEFLNDLGFQLQTVGQLVTYLDIVDNQEALLLIKQKEEVYITKHPLSSSVQSGEDLVLTCIAEGFPKPCYQWYCNNNRLSNQMNSDLKIRNVSFENEGDYYCIVKNPLGERYSKIAQVRIIPSDCRLVNGVTQPNNTSSQNYYSDYQYEQNEQYNGQVHRDSQDFTQRSEYTRPQNREAQQQQQQQQHNYRKQCVYPGQTFKLISPEDSISYQWYKNGYPLQDACCKVLFFNPFKFGDEGFYSCHIQTRDGQSLVSACIQLLIPENVTPALANMPNKEFCTGKVALIISNQDYHFEDSQYQQLVHPINDGRLLADCLESHQFNVFHFNNLNKEDMEQAIHGFCSFIKKTPGLYTVFYFAGHGFDNNGNTYMLPVNVSEHMTCESVISVANVRYQIQSCRSSKFDLLLIDVCRLSIGSIESTKIDPYEPPFIPNAQCIVAYTTSSDNEAYEKRRDHNGIYMKHLSTHIQENIPVETLLTVTNAAVTEEAQLLRLTNSMKPSFISKANKSFSLADGVLPFTGHVTGECDPEVLCFNYHRLPSCQTLHFSYGIVVELKFEFVCSNVITVVVFVQNYGKTAYCDAKVLVNSTEIHVNGKNKERSALPEILSRTVKCNSDCSSESSNSSSIARVTEISQIQKLIDDLKLTISVNYSLNGKEMAEEPLNLKVKIPKDDFGICSFFEITDT